MYSTDGARTRWVTTKSGKRYWFDSEAADAACEIFPKYLRHSKGEWAGRPFNLTRWERRIVRKLFGWKRPDGTRRYRRLWLELPRKNGKTEFAAGLAIVLLRFDGEFGAEIYSLASEEGQARIVFETAVRMVALNDDLNSEIESFKTSLYYSEMMASFKPLSSLPNTKQGFNPSGFIGDEVHVWVSGDLAEGVHEGEGTRAQPLDILITTAGEVGTYAHEQHEYAQAVTRGEIEDDELLVCIFAAADDADWLDEATWRAANPSYEVTVKKSFLEAECRKARNLPRLQNRFRRYYLNQWVEQSVRWIPMEYWDVCTAAPLEAARKRFLSDPERDDKLRAMVENAGAPDPLLWKRLPEMLAGRPCCGGLDLMSTGSDLGALSFVFPPAKADERTAVIWKFYLPRETLKVLKKEVAAQYEAWAAAGALTLTPGNVADYEFVKKDLLEWVGRFRFGTLGIDRYNATQLAVDLGAYQGLNVEFMGQGVVSMNGPSREFERLFMSCAIEHGNNPVARHMAKNVAIEERNNLIKPVKPQAAAARGRGRNQAGGRASGAKIDGIPAAITGLAMTMAKPVEAKSFWEEMA